MSETRPIGIDTVRNTDDRDEKYLYSIHGICGVKCLINSSKNIYYTLQSIGYETSYSTGLHFTKGKIAHFPKSFHVSSCEDKS